MQVAKIIDNIQSNHNVTILEILKGADEFFLISPFLYRDFSKFICNVAKSGIKKICLITTLRDNDLDSKIKAETLLDFCSLCQKNNIKYEIRIDNKLHGKIYISRVDNIPSKGIITSANFTESGLSRNHEWGVQISDTGKLTEIIDCIKNISSQSLTKEALIKIIKKFEDYLKNNPEKSEKQKIEIKISDLIPSQTNKNNVIDDDKKYFIKPVGSREAHYRTEDRFDEGISDHYFSKKYPQAVRVGDILICYAVGTTKLLGYFEVKSAPEAVDPEDNPRWPWRVKALNLSPNYSANWTQYDNTISSIQRNFSLGSPITEVGGYSLNGLRYGHDRIQLKRDFANFVIDIIKAND